jgi:hypothetical protein
MKEKVRDRLAKLFAMLGSNNVGERENAAFGHDRSGHDGAARKAKARKATYDRNSRRHGRRTAIQPARRHNPEKLAD